MYLTCNTFSTFVLSCSQQQPIDCANTFIPSRTHGSSEQLCKVFRLHYAHYYSIIFSCKINEAMYDAPYTLAGASILCQTVLGQNRRVRRGCPVIVSESFYRGEFLENLGAHQTDSCRQLNGVPVLVFLNPEFGDCAWIYIPEGQPFTVKL